MSCVLPVDLFPELAYSPLKVERSHNSIWGIRTVSMILANLTPNLQSH